MLKPLHADSTLLALKLRYFESQSTEAILGTLLPGKPDCLKTRPDGTILDGHHRILVLKKRGIAVDYLPGETITRPPLDE